MEIAETLPETHYPARVSKGAWKTPPIWFCGRIKNVQLWGHDYRRRALVDDAAVRLDAARRAAELVARRRLAARFDATPADTLRLDAVDVSPIVRSVWKIQRNDYFSQTVNDSWSMLFSQTKLSSSLIFDRLNSFLES